MMEDGVGSWKRSGFGGKIEFWREMLTYYGGNFGRAEEEVSECHVAVD